MDIYDKRMIAFKLRVVDINIQQEALFKKASTDHQRLAVLNVWVRRMNLLAIETGYGYVDVMFDLNNIPYPQTWQWLPEDLSIIH